MQTVLTGITSSGIPHLGNYVGAIQPAIKASQDQSKQHLYFIADHHSLVKLWDASVRQDYIYEIAATWLACGLDPDQVIFYRQSEVPEIMELNWIISTVAAKGLLNRAHAYKDQVAKNQEKGDDDDAAITMGLYCYPVLMAADILAFNADIVPVGNDQIQHLEIARDIAQRFNHLYGEAFHLPAAQVDEQAKVLPGLDGRKMSKSYQNTIPIFLESKKLRKTVMKIVTNSQLPEEPKATEGCNVFSLYQVLAKPDEVAEMRQQYASGIGWGDAKQALFEVLEREFSEARERYQVLISDRAELQKILDRGAEQARQIAQPILRDIKQKVGL